MTVIFAVYAAGVLAALLLAGRSCDQAGRKPVTASRQKRAKETDMTTSSTGQPPPEQEQGYPGRTADMDPGPRDGVAEE